MKTTSVNTSISIQTEDMNTSNDKCIGSTVTYKDKKTQCKADLWNTKVVKVKICKKRHAIKV